MSLSAIQALLEQYGYLLVFLIAVVEGPIVVVIASFLASLGAFNIFAIYFIGVMGDIVGDSVYYWIGRSGRRAIIPRYGKYIGVTPARLKAAEEHYDKHLMKTLVLGKITQAPILGVIVTAGITRTNFWKFIGLIALITLPKVLIFTLIGFYLGKSYPLIGHYLNWYLAVAWIVLIVAAIGYWFWRRHKNKVRP